MNDVLPLILFLVLAALFAALGVYILRRPERAAEFFADKHARTPYTPRNTRVTGLAFAVVGSALFAVGAVELVVILVAHAG